MEVRDDVYCLEIARRAVARAALHLGVKCMSQEALNVMGDVLIWYLEQYYGKTLAHLVEASGRSSAHVHALDALRAVEVCSHAPSLARVHLQPPQNELLEQQQQATDVDNNNDNATGADNSRGNHLVDHRNNGSQMNHNNNSSLGTHSTRWHSLASFVFGPNWKATETTTTAQNQQVIMNANGGGKVGPSSTATDAMADDEDDDNNRGQYSAAAGWNAPYIDEVPLFPLFSLKCANPCAAMMEESSTSSNKKRKLSSIQVLADDVNESNQNTSAEWMMQDDVPDDLFFPWGTSERKKKQSAQDENDDEGLPPRKKVKLETAAAGTTTSTDETKPSAEKLADNKTEASTKKAAKAKAKSADDAVEKDKDQSAAAAAPSERTSNQALPGQPLYVPTFYPPAPAWDARTVVDVQVVGGPKTTAAAAESDEAQAAATAEDPFSVRASLVTMGQHTYWGSSWDNDKNTTELQVPLGRSGGATSSSSSGIVPLGRASGSRVSRILEGSMDAAAIS